MATVLPSLPALVVRQPAQAAAERAMAGALLEQRHQLLDLDADSQCRDFPGATCPACPPREGDPR